MKTLSQFIRDGARRLGASPTARLDARVLAKFTLGLSDADIILREGEILNADDAAAFFAAIERRATGEPVAYITGEKEFWSLSFCVTPDVLIPRDDSECLIEAALARRDKKRPLRILDLGTGSGCLLVALLAEFRNATGVGVDQSCAALEIARANAQRNGVGERADFVAGDWFSPISGRFDLIVANPPYIAERDRADLMRDVVDFEPASALFAGADGLYAYRAILQGLPDCLTEDGLALFEVGDGQAATLVDMIKGCGHSRRPFMVKDLKQKDRCVGFDRELREIRD